MEKQSYTLSDKIGIVAGVVFAIISGCVAKSYALNTGRLFWIIWLTVWSITGNVAGTMFGQACTQLRKKDKQRKEG